MNMQTIFTQWWIFRVEVKIKKKVRKKDLASAFKYIFPHFRSEFIASIYERTFFFFWFLIGCRFQYYTVQGGTLHPGLWMKRNWRSTKGLRGVPHLFCTSSWKHSQVREAASENGERTSPKQATWKLDTGQAGQQRAYHQLCARGRTTQNSAIAWTLRHWSAHCYHFIVF